METVVVNGKKFVPENSVKVKVVAPKGDVINPYMMVGKTYFIRTVTHYFTGRLLWVGDKELALGEACWIADTGRFNQFVANGDHNESEPFPKESVVIVGRGSIVDMVQRDLVLVVK